MPLLTPAVPGRFLGIDLRRLRTHMHQAVGLLMRARWLAWLTPAIDVQVRRADGRDEVWTARGDVLTAGRSAAAAAPRFRAVELPPSRYLTRSIVLPVLPADELASAVKLDVLSSSPFPADQLLWTPRSRSRDDGTVHTEVVLTSRQQIEPWLAGLPDELRHPTPEIWAMAGLSEPMPLPGHGELVREREAARTRGWHIGLLTLAILLLAALLLTPTLQLRARAIAAGHAYEALHQRSGQIMTRRDAAMRQAERLASIRKHVSEQAAPVKVLEALSAAIPDDAWLNSLRIDGLSVSLTGVATNAANLMRTLEQVSGVHDIKATAPTTRQPGGSKETFSISLQLDPTQFGLLPPAGGKS